MDDDSEACWRRFLSDFSEHLTRDNVRKIKFQLDIPAGVGDAIKDGLKLIEHLTRKCIIKKEDFTPLYGIIQLIGRKDLRAFLEENERSIDGLVKKENLVKLRSIRIKGMANEQLDATINKESANKKEVEKEYKMAAEPRGLCIIINNTFEKNDAFTTRHGSNKDRDDLAAIFTWLKFDVEQYNDVSHNFMETILELSRSYEKNEFYDCFVCCILSHGLPNGFYTNDGKPVAFSQVKSFFEGDNCPNLHGKPKLFFVQACQGIDDGRTQKMLATDGPSRPPIEQHLDTDSPNRRSSSSNVRQPPIPDETMREAQEPTYLSTDADFFFYVASAPGTVSWRSPLDGTWFIQELCEVFQKHARQKEIMQLCREMNRNISTKSVTQLGKLLSMMPNNFINSLRYELYFHPDLSFAEFQNSL